MDEETLKLIRQKKPKMQYLHGANANNNNEQSRRKFIIYSRI